MSDVILHKSISFLDFLTRELRTSNFVIRKFRTSLKFNTNAICVNFTLLHADQILKFLDNSDLIFVKI